MIRLAFRFADPSDTRDHALVRAIVDALAKHQCSATISVTPFNRVDSVFIDLTRQLTGHRIGAAASRTGAVALQSFSNEDHGVSPSNKPFGFVGRSLTEQRDVIARGQCHPRKMYSGSIRGFMPRGTASTRMDWRRWRRSALPACLRDGRAPQLARKVELALRTCNFATLKSAVRQPRSLCLQYPVIALVMHQYDLAESREPEAITSLRAFDELLGWLKGHPDPKVSTLREIATPLDPADSRRALARNRFQQPLPLRLRRARPEQNLSIPDRRGARSAHVWQRLDSGTVRRWSRLQR